jgi:hypothetical protein
MLCKIGKFNKHFLIACQAKITFVASWEALLYAYSTNLCRQENITALCFLSHISFSQVQELLFNLKLFENGGLNLVLCLLCDYWHFNYKSGLYLINTLPYHLAKSVIHNVVDGTLYTTYKEKWATTVFEEGVSLWNLAVLALVRPHWF